MSSQVPAQFADDPIASRTSWTPLVRGGASFRTRQLEGKGHDRYEFVATKGMLLAPMLLGFFSIVEVGFTFFMYQFLAGDRGIGELLESGNYLPLMLLVSGVFGVLITLVFAAILWRMTRKPVVFDRSSGYYWKGFRNPIDSHNSESISDSARLDEVAGLQVLSEYVESRDTEGATRRFHSYELNIVLSDASRLGVVDHADLTALRRDAETLGEFLNVPVWDGTTRSE